MPRGMMPQWDTVARNNTLVNQTVSYAEDDVGRRIIKFKGLPILFGYEPDDSPDLLPFNEVAAGGGAIALQQRQQQVRVRRVLRPHHRAVPPFRPRPGDGREVILELGVRDLRRRRPENS